MYNNFSQNFKYCFNLLLHMGKYVFKNILGSFIFDDKGTFIKKGDSKGLQDPPEEILPKILSFFKDNKFHKELYKKNLALTKQAIKASVSDDHIIIQCINNIDELTHAANTLSKRLREWYSLYNPESTSALQQHQTLARIIAQ